MRKQRESGKALLTEFVADVRFDVQTLRLLKIAVAIPLL